MGTSFTPIHSYPFEACYKFSTRLWILLPNLAMNGNFFQFYQDPWANSILRRPFRLRHEPTATQLRLRFRVLCACLNPASNPNPLEFQSLQKASWSLQMQDNIFSCDWRIESAFFVRRKCSTLVRGWAVHHSFIACEALR